MPSLDAGPELGARIARPRRPGTPPLRPCLQGKKQNFTPREIASGALWQHIVLCGSTGAVPETDLREGVVCAVWCAHFGGCVQPHSNQYMGQRQRAAPNTPASTDMRFVRTCSELEGCVFSRPLRALFVRCFATAVIAASGRRHAGHALFGRRAITRVSEG